MITQTKGEFLSDCLVETLNDFWKVNRNLNLVVLFILNWRLKLVGNMLRSGVSLLVYEGRLNGRSYWMFVDKNNGACYKPTHTKHQAVGIRYQIEDLIEDPTICDPYGSFLYLK